MTFIINLAGLDWRFGQAPRQPFGPQPVDDMNHVTAWLPARVPGDIRADLLAAGQLRALDTPEDVAASQWVDDVDWWYRASLPVAPAPHECVVLEAEGIDYASAIWLNERLLATHAGMFSRQVVCLTPALAASRPNELRIRVWGSGALTGRPAGRLLRGARTLVTRLSPGTEFFPDRMQAPKAQFGYGWDFAPRVLTSGIWDDIRLITCRGAYLEDVQVLAEPLQAGDLTPVRWRVRLRVQRFSSAPIRAAIIVRDSKDRIVGGHVVAAMEVGRTELSFVTPQVWRWWPWDQGEPHRYSLTVQLLDNEGVADERTVVTGVRTIRRAALASGQPWRFAVNDRHVFLRGANWTPADVLPGRVTPDDYHALLEMARGAGINFLRVWGGGLREKQAFWETCDLLGILAWQEFPLACAFLDHYPRDAAYLHILEQEARSTVRRLRNHPSLLAWCGGNEINPTREAIPLARISGVLVEEDPDRLWIPASPHIATGDVHDWDVWHGKAPWTQWRQNTAAFLSEFGLQALPAAETVAEMWAGSPPPLQDATWATRKAQVAKLRHYAGPGLDRSSRAAVELSQRVQAAGLQTAIESSRLRREPATQANAVEAPSLENPCGGLAFWQFNEPWPAVTWAVVDHARRPKLAYHMLMRSYQPLLVAARFAYRVFEAGERFTAEIWIVNDAPHDYADVTVESRLDDDPVWRSELVYAPGGAAIRVAQFCVVLTQPPKQLNLLLRHGAEEIALNTYDLTVPLPPPQALLPRLRRFLVDWLMTG